jgi:sulfur-oxidizing protein SoxY
MDRRKFLGVGVAAFAAMVMPSTDLKAMNFRADKPKAWEAVDSTSAIREMYGSGGLKETKDIKLKAPKLAENGGSIPINIKSKMDLESIAIFQDANPRSAVAVFSVPKNGIVNYDLRIKMRKTSDVIVVAKGRDGVLYTISQKVEVSIGGCGG